MGNFKWEWDEQTVYKLMYANRKWLGCGRDFNVI